MKTVVKIDPQKEYDSAKGLIQSIASSGNFGSEVSELDGSIDNLKTVINVLMDRLTPKPKKRPPKHSAQKKKGKKPRIGFDKLPSEKFPNLEVNEEVVRADATPQCPCCSSEMKESGLYKTSEKLEVIPKQYYIVRKKRVIYNCNTCNGYMVNTPSCPSICRSSNYGDSVVIDAALSKYCDLIPMERYSAMAAREGVEGLPPNSLIGLTHSLAEFLAPVYRQIKEEVEESQVLMADETPHKMLEGDSTGNWYLWGFSCKHAAYFEAHNTRSGDVPLSFLSNSKTCYLVTDGYGGYKRALRELREKFEVEVSEVYCNAHSFRYFRDASTNWEQETTSILSLYGQIFELERATSNDREKKLARKNSRPLFEKIRAICQELGNTLVSKSSLEKAVNYFLNHYGGLTECLNNIEIPLDNNFSERLLRSPVVGRKTWYGTHSKRGARTNAVLFSIVETCKINRINPRSYFLWVTDQLHRKNSPVTPSQYKKSVDLG